MLFCLLIGMFLLPALLSGALAKIHAAGGAAVLLQITFTYACYTIFPALAFVLIKRIPVREWIPFQKINIVVLLAGILAGALLLYISVFINAVFMQFMPYSDAVGYDLIMESPLWWDIALMAVIGPVAEEFMSRGLFYHAYKEGGIVSAILGSSIVFGILHLSAAQLPSVMIIGVSFCLLVEITGSIYTSMAAHSAFNAIIVILDHAGSSASAGEQDFIGLGIRALVSVAALVGLLFWLAKYCKREEHMRRCFAKDALPSGIKRYFSFVTPMFVAAGILAAVFMALAQMA